MADALAYLIVALAVYRLATDIAYEDGPFDVFVHLRTRISGWVGPHHWMANGVQCPICLSFWLALPAAFVWGVMVWLAIAGLVAFLVRRSHG